MLYIVHHAEASLKIKSLTRAMENRMQRKRPNIILITSDQHRWDCFGFGPRQARMPHLTRLAKKGVRFENCTTANPLCQPARASILTGMLPYTHGVVDNGIDLNINYGEQGFASTLSKNGYKTAIIGKAHFSSKATFEATGTPECQFSSVNYDEKWNGPYMGFEHVELMVVGHFSRVVPPQHIHAMPFSPPHGLHYERWFHSRGETGEARRLWEESTDGRGLLAPQTWNSALPAAWHPTTWVTDRSINYLQERAKQDDPFCLWISYPDPHHPFDCPEPWNKLYDPAEVDLPKHRQLDLENRPWWHTELYGKVEKIGREQYASPNSKQKVSRISNPTEEELRHITANYYGMISFLDHGLGRLTSAIQDLGLDKDTIIVFTTDHGELLGDHGLMLKGPTLYEGLVRIGMVVVAPDSLQDKNIYDPVSTIDLAATFYDYANIERPETILQSNSLRSLISGTSKSERDCAYCEWKAGEERYGVDLDLRMIRTSRYKAIFELNSNCGELYDLEEDPQEMSNLYDDPGYSLVRKQLRDHLMERPGNQLSELPKRSGLT